MELNAPPVSWVVKCNVLASNSPLVRLATIKDCCVCAVQCVNWEREWTLSTVLLLITMMFSAAVYREDGLINTA